MRQEKITKEKVLMTGNEAMARGAIEAGCSFYAGYPITPQNEIPAYMAIQMPASGGVFIQAESEIAAINMVFGAAAAGTRAMTSSSSPGVSLMQEGISYIAGAALPAVILNVMRGGPGLGNIAPSQSDYFQATRSGGHGDYRCIVLAPGSVQEAYDIMPIAFDLADKYRNPVMVLSDGMLGQMMEPIQITKSPRHQPARYKKPWALTGCRNRKPNVVKSFYIAEGELERWNLELQKKYQAIEKNEQRLESMFSHEAETIIVSYGTMARIAKSLVMKLRSRGKKIGLIRPITLWPFPKKGFNSLKRNQKILVVEMSYGQMLEDVRMAVGDKFKVGFLGRSGGGIPKETEIVRALERL
ncbi:MAG: 3-methyl-2-oxobutanoate dehydrogenase subunit VorB [Candidatus Omnitrophica bacterium]|nr:3-methyl-2-oxobutanoate dehydrogenase subunit VorB [Candidatus Omnitrophota bacterium]